ncbi:hypothetical protein VTP01DRAFT_8826 [Rhizomucor pusillus]|uniref:uncharacterized protein n=1 Tax=Rhizomucor pusillus TaxID=4840 RepID=UPI003742BD4A
MCTLKKILRLTFTRPRQSGFLFIFGGCIAGGYEFPGINFTKKNGWLVGYLQHVYVIQRMRVVRTTMKERKKKWQKKVQ